MAESAALHQRYLASLILAFEFACKLRMCRFPKAIPPIPWPTVLFCSAHDTKKKTFFAQALHLQISSFLDHVCSFLRKDKQERTCGKTDFTKMLPQTGFAMKSSLRSAIALLLCTILTSSSIKKTSPLFLACLPQARLMSRYERDSFIFETCPEEHNPNFAWQPACKSNFCKDFSAEACI